MSSVWEGLAHPVRRNTSVLKFYSSTVSSRYFERYTCEKCLSKVNVQMHFNKLKEHFQDTKEVQKFAKRQGFFDLILELFQQLDIYMFFYLNFINNIELSKPNSPVFITRDHVSS